MEKLLKLAITLSLLGTITLLALSFLPPKTLTATEIYKSEIGQKVSISAKVILQRQYGNLAILTLQDEAGKIEATCSCAPEQNYTNKKIKTEGVISEFNNKKQLDINKIKIIK